MLLFQKDDLKSQKLKIVKGDESTAQLCSLQVASTTAIDITNVPQIFRVEQLKNMHY